MTELTCAQTCTIAVLVTYVTPPRLRLCGQPIVRSERCGVHARSFEAHR